MEKLKVLELFGGIGACSKAIERLGIDYEIVDYVEIDKYAVKSFNAIHNTNFEPQDICEWNKDIEVDLIMHGSPCQDFSSIGLGLGGDKDSGTRSSLMYETIRIVEKLKPKYVIWENVKNLLSKKHRHNFDRYITKMRMLGYWSYYQVLNAKDYGIPQNRERVFVVSIRDDVICYGCQLYNYQFPPKQELKLRLKDMLEDEVDEKYFLSEEITNKLESKNLLTINKRLHTMLHKININTVQSIDMYNQLTYDDIMFTVTTRVNASSCTAVTQYNRIRKFTPLEIWRLMGFDDEDYNKAAEVNSNAQLYKQAGNSIVVNVLEAILKNLLLNTEQEEE